MVIFKTASGFWLAARSESQNCLLNRDSLLMKSHCTWNLFTFSVENIFANRLGLFAIHCSQSV